MTVKSLVKIADALISDGIEYDELDGYNPLFSSPRVDPATVGQYTGLTDKNGKRIFEGDIVKRCFTLCRGPYKETREVQVGVVFYSNYHCGYVLKNICNLRRQYPGDTIEVIGNIHDNREMIGWKEECQ